MNHYVLMQFSWLILRYLVDARWWKQWKKFVGYDTWDRNGEQLNDPGPIDNSSLLARKT